MLIHEEIIQTPIAATIPLTITINTICANCKAEITPKHVEGNIYEIEGCGCKAKPKPKTKIKK